MLRFDHPLFERIRSLIRIKHLFNRFNRTVAYDDKWSHHVAVASLFEIMDCSSRAELKLDILQELERQRQMISQQNVNPELLERLTRATQDLQDIQQKFGQHIRENEWLLALKQRMAVAGGTTPVELPGYYFWQNKSADERRQDLHAWSQAMMPTFRATDVLLEILRSHEQVMHCHAKNGYYECSSMPHNVHLLTIEVSVSEGVLPEVAANKYFTHIRFLATDQRNMRGSQVERDISFNMIMCSFDDEFK